MTVVVCLLVGFSLPLFRTFLFTSLRCGSGSLFAHMPFNFSTRKRLPFYVFDHRNDEKHVFTRERQQKVTVGRADANCLAHSDFLKFHGF